MSENSKVDIAGNEIQEREKMQEMGRKGKPKKGNEEDRKDKRK